MRTLVVTMALIAAYSPGTQAQELTKTSWPSFRNGDSQQGIATSKLPEKLELLWELKSPDGWPGTVAIVGDHVYAPALEGYLYCLNLKTGKVIWKYRSIESTDPTEFAAGFKAAPRVTKDGVFIGDEDGYFHAIDRATGKAKWKKFETGAEIAGGAGMVGGNLLVPSHDGRLYCLSQEGKLIWKFETEAQVNCSPAIRGKYTFVAGCDEHLRVIDIAEGKEARNVPLQSPLIASPAIYEDMLYVGTHTGLVVAVNWRTGKIIWRYKAKRPMEYHASAAVTKDVVLVGGHDKILHCLDRSKGTPRWTFKTNARINSSPVVVGKRVFFGSDDGNIYGVNLADGKQNWKFTAGKDITAGPAVGEGHLVIGSSGSNGRLYCFGAKKK